MDEWDFKRLAKEDEAVLVQERRLLATALQSTTRYGHQSKFQLPYLLLKSCGRGYIEKKIGWS